MVRYIIPLMLVVMSTVAMAKEDMYYKPKCISSRADYDLYVVCPQGTVSKYKEITILEGYYTPSSIELREIEAKEEAEYKSKIEKYVYITSIILGLIGLCVGVRWLYIKMQ